jgi:thiamine kinase
MRQSGVYVNLTPSERIAQIKSPALHRVHWQPLTTTGTSNALLRGVWQNQAVIVRLNASGVLTFGVDRQREAAVLSQIQGQPWAPHILANAPDDGWMLMADYGDHRPQAALIPWHALLLACQQITTVPRLDYTLLIAAYAEALPNTPMTQKLIRQMTDTLAALPDHYRCLVHHDLHPGNLVGTAEDWRVIDWEYAGLGCPWLDIAAVQQQGSMPIDIVATLPVAAGYRTDQLVEILGHAHQMNKLLEQAWLTVRKDEG